MKATLMTIDQGPGQNRKKNQRRSNWGSANHNHNHLDIKNTHSTPTDKHDKKKTFIRGTDTNYAFPPSPLLHFVFLVLNIIKLKLVSFSPITGVGSANSSQLFTGKSRAFPALPLTAFSHESVVGQSLLPRR